MNQQTLWHDTLSDALRAVVEGLGPKRVATELWPSKPIRDAHRRLLHCLDDERDEKLSLDEIEAVLKAGRQAGIHTGMAYLTTTCGYEEARPVEPEDEKAKLQREYIAAVKALEGLTKRLEGV